MDINQNELTESIQKLDDMILKMKIESLRHTLAKYVFLYNSAREVLEQLLSEAEELPESEEAESIVFAAKSVV